MWRAIVLTAFIAAAVSSHPISDSEVKVINNGEEQSNAIGNIRQKRDDQEVNDEALQNDEEQSADDGSIRQKRDTTQEAGTAVQNDETQEACADDGHGGENCAQQGDEGQFIQATDFGGPIVQILQRVFRSGNCCACGCDCGCPDETTTEAP